MKRGILILAALAAGTALAPGATHADELKLKDGTKISGVIVGFEENSFKVKTSYGFALVQRDQVVSITISEVAKKLEPEKKPEPAADKPAPAPKSTETKTVAAATPAPAPAPVAPAFSATAAASSMPSKSPAESSAKPAAIPTSTTPPASADASASKPSPTPAAPAPSPATASAKTSPAPATTPSQPASSAPSPATAKNVPASAPAAAPAKPAEPPMLEQVNGNSYINETYGFRMYKPPAWRVIEGARSIMPGAITAMGTSDETTYLLIGQQAPGKSLASDIDAAERRLRDILENYRPLGEKRITVSGVTAIEHTFRGSVDKHDWSGIVVFVPFGTHLYTVFGMTSADSDLVQIQENVISRTISSLQFTR
ncbi:MAG TPA: hypothetical protein VEF54_02045 [archaeon]|nr:hypothetical protein [archaeon]